MSIRRQNKPRLCAPADALPAQVSRGQYICNYTRAHPIFVANALALTPALTLSSSTGSG